MATYQPTGNGFIGLDTSGISKITTALDAYIKAIKSVSFYATATETQAFAKGSSSYQAMMTMMSRTDQEMERLVTEKLTPLRSRLQGLSSKYQANDQSQASTMQSKAKSILKS